MSALIRKSFLIISLCNSSGNSLLDIISFLTVPTKVFYQQKFKNSCSECTLITVIFWVFSNINALSRNTLSAAVLLFKNLQKPYHVETKLYLIRFDKYILNLMFL